jgi:hypothetical protein
MTSVQMRISAIRRLHAMLINMACSRTFAVK